VGLAVGLVVGGALTNIGNYPHSDIVRPPIGCVLAQVSLTDLFFSQDGKDYASLTAARDAGAPILAYGNFLSVIVQFFVIAMCIFLVVKALNTFHHKNTPPPAGPTKTELLLKDIRDELRKKAK